ncbi:MAG: TRAP transporter large permease [Burkholderiaceae bacterium]|nr:TRAP transporter large permease [Burkholderiaceae bacterium]
MIAIPFVILLLLLAIGMPIGFALIAASLTTLYTLGLAPLTLVPDILYESVGHFTLLAIPFFLLAAELLSAGGLIDRIFDLALAIVGRLRGGMGAACVVATGLFAGIQGSSAADAAAIGKIGTTGMMRQGYRGGFSAALIAAAGATAILIPPSIAMLIYASMVNVSVGRMFFAGIVPGVLNVIAFLVFVVVRAHHLGWRADAQPPFATTAQRLGAFRRAFWVLTLPLFILYGFYTGNFTATEISTASAMYAGVLALFVYRTLRTGELGVVIMQTARTTVNLFTIIAGAVLLSKVLTFLNAPRLIFGIIEDFHLSGWQFLLVISAVMFVLGMFMEAVALNVMTTPILAPIAMKLGIDPVHYGIVLILNIEVALITPPVGLNLFVLAGATRLPLHEIFREVLPFVAILTALLILIIFVPQISLWLPDLLMPSP